MRRFNPFWPFRILRTSLNSRWRHVSIVSAVLIALTTAGGVFIGANAIRLFDDMRVTWHHYDTVSEQKIAYLTSIHRYLGYSGMAQHLKDYLLHGDAQLLGKIDIDLDQAKNSIDSYRLLDISRDEARALDTLGALVTKARASIAEIPKLRAQGLRPAQIDTRIDLSADAATQALDQLRWAWREQAELTRKVMNQNASDGEMMVKLGWIFLPIMASIAAIVFWLVARLCRQVAAYEHEKAALAKSEQKFRDMAANVPGVIFQWYERTGGERGYLYVSPRCQELYGVTPEELKRDWEALNLHPDDKTRYHTTIRQAFETKSEWSFEGRFLTPEGEERWGRCLSKPVPVNDEEIIFNGVMIDISLQKQMEEELRALATTDALTNTYNRRHFLHLAEAEMTRAKRYEGPLSVLLFDLDLFKTINDTHGHAGGDEVLRRFAETVKDHLRSTDILGRIGGEEFAVLLPETDLNGAIALAERIRKATQQNAIPWNGGKIDVTASIGVASMGELDKTIALLLDRADKALYAAKNRGRNQVVVSAGSGKTAKEVPAFGDGPELPDLTRTKAGPHGVN